MEARLAKCCVLIPWLVYKCADNSDLKCKVSANQMWGLFIGIYKAVIVEVTLSSHVLYFPNTYFTNMSAQGDISGSHAATTLCF